MKEELKPFDLSHLEENALAIVDYFNRYMTRIIKFRCWDRTKRRMLENVSTGTVKVFGDYKELDSTSEAKDCEFMQYTGLKDKNGKEIYEGDIVKYQDRVSQIKFGRNDKWKECNGFYLDDDYVDNWGMAWHWEIIGNIYENPELLTPNLNK